MKTLILVSSDNQSFEVSDGCLVLSDTNLILFLHPDDHEHGRGYCKCMNPSHCNFRNPHFREKIKEWDAEFVKVDQATLFDLILVSSMFSPL